MAIVVRSATHNETVRLVRKERDAAFDEQNGARNGLETPQNELETARTEIDRLNGELRRLTVAVEHPQQAGGGNVAL